MDSGIKDLTTAKADSPSRGSTWHLQPKQGCSVCRVRHVKCEESKTGSGICKACLKTGRTCPGFEKDPFLAIAWPMPKISRGALEEATFDKFVNRFAPWLGRYTDETFWVKSVLPAAEGNDSVFSAALAVTALLDMPIQQSAITSNNGTQSEYQTAIAWYRKSVNASIGSVADKKSAPDISVLLLTTVIYINIEMRQGHYHNLHGLIRTAFALTYSAKSTLWKSKDPIVLASLVQVLEGSIAMVIDSICIPKSHRDFAIVLILRIASEIGASEIDQLRFELLSLIHDVTAKCIAAEDCRAETSCIIFSLGPCPALASGYVPSEEEEVTLESDTEALENRMRDWYKRIVKYKAKLHSSNDSAHALWRQYTMFFQVRAHWQAHIINKRSNMDKEALEERFSSLFELFEELALNDPPSWITEMAIVPPCLTMVWYLRDESVLERIVKMFKLYKIYNKNEFMENVLEYLEELTKAEYTKPTEIEQELFGHTPTILKKWHVYMFVQHLVRMKRPPK